MAPGRRPASTSASPCTHSGTASPPISWLKVDIRVIQVLLGHKKRHHGTLRPSRQHHPARGQEPAGASEGAARLTRAAMPRGSLEVADVFRAHGPAWRRARAGHLIGQLKVMSPSSTAARRRSAATWRPARSAAIPTSPTIPAATATARSVKARRPRTGWPRARLNSCRWSITTSSSPCRRRSPTSLTTTRR